MVYIIYIRKLNIGETEKKESSIRRFLKKYTGKAGWLAAYVYLHASISIAVGNRHPAAYVISAIASAWVIESLALIGAFLAFYSTFAGNLFGIASMAGICLLPMLTKEYMPHKWHYLFAALSAILFAVHFILNNSSRTQPSDPAGSVPARG